MEVLIIPHVFFYFFILMMWFSFTTIMCYMLLHSNRFHKKRLPRVPYFYMLMELYSRRNRFVFTKLLSPPWRVWICHCVVIISLHFFLDERLRLNLSGWGHKSVLFHDVLSVYYLLLWLLICHGQECSTCARQFDQDFVWSILRISRSRIGLTEQAIASPTSPHSSSVTVLNYCLLPYLHMTTMAGLG